MFATALFTNNNNKEKKSSVPPFGFPEFSSSPPSHYTTKYKYFLPSNPFIFWNLKHPRRVSSCNCKVLFIEQRYSINNLHHNKEVEAEALQQPHDIHFNKTNIS